MNTLSFTSVLLGPLGIVALSVVFIVVAIAVFRLNAFFALILAATLVGLLTAAGKTGDLRFSLAIDAVMTELGAAVGKIGFTIALAAVIGMCLMESGAADKIIRRFIATLGEERAPLALLACGFILAAPVFIDTVFLLLLPLARSLSLRTGKNYLLYALATCVGGVITNGIVPPAPGPLVVAETLKLDLGLAILGGIAFGLLPAYGGLWLARWFNSRLTVPVRPPPGSSLETLAAIAQRSETELPGFGVSIAPVVLPMVLIGAASCLGAFRAHLPAAAMQLIGFLGNKNVALAIGATIALIVYARQKKLGWRGAGKTLGAPLETGGVIILIVAAGAAYGAMIKNAGVGDAVRTLAGDHSLHYVLLAWSLAVFIRAAQGSATVATITAANIVLSIAGPGGFGVHPLYIFLACGFGSKALSWMNDGGFWVVSRIGGLTEGEMLRSWSIMVTLVSVLGLIEVLIVSSLFPQLWF
jgi:gluconate:H+ symporter, GntP family